MTLTALAWVSVALAAVPAVMFVVNLFFYRPSGAEIAAQADGISVLIPARNEEGNIAAAVASVLRNEYQPFEVVAADDHSEDRTAEIVTEMALRDRRVRLIETPELPDGWCGKSHACAVAAEHAKYLIMLFLDADVRLAPTALRRIVAFMESSGADLASGVPEERTGSLSEACVIPLIHFMLLGFLPMSAMRRSRHPAFSAGCGQLMVARREAYRKAGGHAAVKTSLHDGLTLPRVFRRAGFRTDLFDATALAQCRMYNGPREVWHGLLKNAIEGMAAPTRILPFTLLLLGGQAGPFVLLPAALLTNHAGPAIALGGIGVALAYLPRLLGIWRFRHSAAGALLHPVGVCVFVAAQWVALIRWIMGRPASWKGRQYGPGDIRSAAKESEGPNT